MLALPELVRVEPAPSWDGWGPWDGAGPGCPEGVLRGPGQPLRGEWTQTGPVISAADERRSSVGRARAERGTGRTGCPVTSVCP